MPADITKEPRLQTDRQLLSMLVCPQSSMPLIYDKAENELISPALGVAFPVTKGVPVLVIKEARMLDETQKAVLKTRDRTRN